MLILQMSQCLLPESMCYKQRLRLPNVSPKHIKEQSCPQTRFPLTGLQAAPLRVFSFTQKLLCFAIVDMQDFQLPLYRRS